MNDTTHDDFWDSYDGHKSSLPTWEAKAPPRRAPERRRIIIPGQPDPEPSAPDDGLPFLSIAELLDRPEDATAWLVDGLLPAGGFGVFAGKPKAGKSTAARHLAHAVATGEPWIGRATMTGPTLYLALEEKVSEVRRHFMALGTPRDAPLHVCFHRTPGDAGELLAQVVAEHKPVLVVLDTLFRFQPVHDTDAYGGVLKALSPLHEIARDSGAHILAVHHERKAEGEGGDRMLGSTAIFGMVDVMLSIGRRYADDVRVLSSIGRYGDDLPETVVELRPDGSVHLAGAVEDMQARRAREQVLECITEYPGATNDEIRAKAGLRWQVAHPALRDLVREQVVERSGNGRQGDPYRHHVVIPSGTGNLVPGGLPACSRLYTAGTGGQAPVRVFREQAGTGGQEADSSAYRRATDGD